MCMSSGKPLYDLVKVAMLDAQLPQALDVAEQLAIDVVLGVFGHAAVFLASNRP